MCYAIPAQLISIDGDVGVIDYFGERRKILIDLPEVRVGDYVYAQGGVLVRKIPKEEALTILAHWQKIFFELKKTDEALSKIDPEKLDSNALAIFKKIDLRKTLSKSELLSLLKLEKPEELSVLYEIANNIRQREHGNASCVHGIIEFSNYCSANCFYCGIRKDRELPRYRMTVEEIIAAAKNAVDRHGFKAIVLQSGEDFWYADDKLETIVRALRQMGILIFLSLGMRSKETYRKLYEAGARAALLRFETTNEKSFSMLRPGTSLTERIELIKYLKELKYVLATGFIIGLPGDTNEDLVNNILMTRYLAPDMYSFGPFIPAQDTPLSNYSKVTKHDVLKAISLARFVDSNSNILVTTALETLDFNAKKEALLAGANSLMINITPQQYQHLYAIYDNKAGISKSTDEEINNLTELLYSLGRAPTDLGVGQ